MSSKVLQKAFDSIFPICVNLRQKLTYTNKKKNKLSVSKEQTKITAPKLSSSSVLHQAQERSKPFDSLVFDYRDERKLSSTVAFCLGTRDRRTSFRVPINRQPPGSQNRLNRLRLLKVSSDFVLTELAGSAYSLACSVARRCDSLDTKRVAQRLESIGRVGGKCGKCFPPAEHFTRASPREPFSDHFFHFIKNICNKLQKNIS